MRWRRAALAALAIVAFLPARAGASEGPCTGDWSSDRQVARGIRCVWDRFHPGHGGTPAALRVARCESGLEPNAYYLGNGGLFQHKVRLWPERYRTLVLAFPSRRAWGLGSSVYDGRTNAIVTALFVRRYGGWGAWSCQP